MCVPALTRLSSSRSFSNGNCKGFTRNLQRRVVVTGLGIVSPLGLGTKYVWQKLLEASCGIIRLDSPDYDKLPCKIGL